jgi:hypothetical protein
MPTFSCLLPFVRETEHSMTIRSAHAPPDVHDMETPEPLVLESDVNRMNMLPDVAVCVPGIVVPLSLPKRVPDVDEPS